MSDPLMPEQPKTRRAEPLQPDRPGRGDKAPGVPKGSVQSTPPGADPAARRERAEDEFEESSESQRQQSENALENVREGYGR